MTNTVDTRPEAKTMNTLEAYNEGFLHGVSFCKKYGIPSETTPTTPIEDKGNVLFTTVDGVGIKAYDIFYYVGDAYNVCETFILPHEEWKQLRNKSFSTKEAAEQYIIENKPCLSLSDLLLLGITEHHQYYKILSKLAKQKLNQ